MRRQPEDIELILADSDRIIAALRGAVLKALAEHKRAGEPIVVWQDGKVVWLPPEAIPEPDPSAEDVGTQGKRGVPSVR